MSGNDSLPSSFDSGNLKTRHVLTDWSHWLVVY